ncbi:uncharacterized protein OCT59_027592 [Rhizophagus irregularis]|uniref:Uncharacterized protein n=3 Tax=Rhizophagus irregularis TaxID=588596 RepID=A0A2I1E5Z0_9GLOM|nr:hypothetical protein RirG_194240 [Rhizophagus irregularis DAOM 197198w]PKY17489.1 hypothetical protein RhiirB3_404378 [Rhizophagus irregularis]GBC14169.1 hypothetical protein GLOIN_2v1641234 [Rhizophagus irregularis DAOM 181602=DAOM 197198]UZO07306.1 hypothetical protein OCT59_027592 [Rhizophagus irregularis]CAB4479189.1 unnamed protein product [Rhizophagus irregularis]
MPPARRRTTLPLSRDTETTRLIARSVQETASQAVKDFIVALEDLMLNGISTLDNSSLNIKYYNSSFTRPQILKDGSAVFDQRLCSINNGYSILKSYRKQIKNHLIELFPQMTWRTEMGNGYIGVTIANYGLGDDILTIKTDEKNKDEIKDKSKDCKDCK